MLQPNMTLLLHTWEASPPASAGARRSLAGGADLPVPEHSSVLGLEKTNPAFRREPRRKSGQSSCPVGAKGGALRCNCLSAISLLTLSSR